VGPIDARRGERVRCRRPKQNARRGNGREGDTDHSSPPDSHRHPNLRPARQAGADGSIKSVVGWTGRINALRGVWLKLKSLVRSPSWEEVSRTDGRGSER